MTTLRSCAARPFQRRAPRWLCAAVLAIASGGDYLPLYCLCFACTVGLLLHQWDGQEEVGRPWRMCLERCFTQGSLLHGRVSAMAVYHDLRLRRDRLAIPLPFEHRGGLLFRPEYVRLECLYGIECVHALAKFASEPVPASASGEYMSPIA